MATNLVDSNKSTKLIELDIGYDIVLPIIINSDTGLLYEISETVNFGGYSSVQPQNRSQSNQLSLKPNELFPKATDVALSFYVYFLRGKELKVVTRADMIDCLTLYSLSGDTNFFETLLKSLFKLWTVLSPVLYSSKVTEETKWEVWLRCPFQLLPDDWLEDETFVSVWRQRTDNKYLLLNGGEVFDFEHVEVEQQSEQGEEGEEESSQQGHIIITKTTSYTRQHDNVELTHFTLQDVSDGVMDEINTYTSYNGRRQGQVEIVDTITGVIHDIFIDDKSNGPSKNYIKGKLSEEAYYMDGIRQGLETDYYSTGRVKKTTHFVDGDRDGLETNYRNDTESTVESTVKWKAYTHMERVNYQRDGSYIKTEYDADGMQSGYRFYDPESRLKREITYPVGIESDKVDVIYDDNRKVVSSTTHGEDERYDIRTNTWRVF